MARKRHNEQYVLRLLGEIEAHLMGRFGSALDGAILGQYLAEYFGSLTKGLTLSSVICREAGDLSLEYCLRKVFISCDFCLPLKVDYPKFNRRYCTR